MRSLISQTALSTSEKKINYKNVDSSEKYYKNVGVLKGCEAPVSLGKTTKLAAVRETADKNVGNTIYAGKVPKRASALLTRFTIDLWSWHRRCNICERIYFEKIN